ncbi:transmembrane protein, putative [Medicago truncatula]|uniref:Transmembrane protein, putative n=1 Tax=Medicago truncatula TaxID=3880 RepID=G7I4H5_MEDTR|nr:transmembrane protein, putative [Medicago truncatula]
MKDSEQRHSKLLGRIAVIVFNVPFPLHLPFFQNFQKSMEPCPWQVTIQFIKFEPVPIHSELSFILFA